MGYLSDIYLGSPILRIEKKFLMFLNSLKNGLFFVKPYINHNFLAYNYRELFEFNLLRATAWDVWL